MANINKKDIGRKDIGRVVSFEYLTENKVGKVNIVYWQKRYGVISNASNKHETLLLDSVIYYIGKVNPHLRNIKL